MICHIIIKCLLSGNCPQLWEGSKTELSPRDGEADFAGSKASEFNKILQKFPVRSFLSCFGNNNLRGGF